MTRSKLAKLEHELHNEPRNHEWRPIGNTKPVNGCTRPGCGFLWHTNRPEPAGCTGANPETERTTND